jgi:N-methylhydantoinase A
VIRGVAELLEEAGAEGSTVTYCGVGSTLALNTLLERCGARTGLLVTRGFRDVLEVRRTRLPDAPSFEARGPQPLVPRGLVREARERLLADGRVWEPLDLEEGGSAHVQWDNLSVAHGEIVPFLAAHLGGQERA